MGDWTQKPAAAALQAGAKHYILEGTEAQTADKDVLLPLCQRMESELKAMRIRR